MRYWTASIETILFSLLVSIYLESFHCIYLMDICKAPPSAGKTFISFYAKEKVLGPRMMAFWCTLPWRKPLSLKWLRRSMHTTARMSKMVRAHPPFYLAMILPGLGFLWAIHIGDYNKMSDIGDRWSLKCCWSWCYSPPPLARTWLLRMKRLFLSMVCSWDRHC
jgi:hypothetical protein